MALGQSGDVVRASVPEAEPPTRKGTNDAKSALIPIFWTAVAFLVAGLSYWLGEYLIHHPHDAHGSSPKLLVVSSDWSALGALFVMALAIERLLNPFSEWLGPSTTQAAQARDAAKATAESTASKTAAEKDGAATKLAAAEDNLTYAKRGTAVMTWAVATGVAFILCGWLKILLLSAIVDTAQGGTPNRIGDLLVTGLVVGAGTKPLHDLVSNIQKSSAAKG